MTRFAGGFVALAVVLAMAAAHAQDLTGQYANSPNAEWFGRQYNAQGGFCCNSADGHLFTDGDYQIDADGTVTLFLKDGGKITLAYDVAHGLWDGIKKNSSGGYTTVTPDPNPTGYPVLWYTGTLQDGQSSNIYCFSPGALT